MLLCILGGMVRGRFVSGLFGVSLSILNKIIVMMISVGMVSNVWWIK